MKPEIVIWEITRRCNFNCGHCVVAADRAGGGRAEISLDEATGLLEQMAALGTRSIFFSGGEPFLRRDLATIMRRGREIAPFSFGIASNGSVMKASVLEEMRGLGLESVQVSLDGATSELNAAMRKGPPRIFEKALESMRTCKRLGIPITLGMFLHPGNIDFLPDIVALAAREGIPVVRFSGFIPLGRGANPEIQASMKYQYQQMVTFFERVAAHDPLRTGVTLAFDHAFGPTDPCFRCTAGDCSMYLTAEGNVHPCPSFLHPDYLVGNVRSDRLASLWARDRMRDFRIPPEQITGPCAECPDLASCRGGCRGTTYAYTRDTRASFPNCLRRYRRHVMAVESPPSEASPSRSRISFRSGRGGLQDTLDQWYDAHALRVDHLLETHPLSYLLWQSTLRCNLRCNHCAVPRETRVKGKEMTTAQICDVLSRFARDFDVRQISALAISGGEPALRPDLADVVRHAVGLGLRVGLDSNGSLLGRRTELIDRLVDAGVTIPCFSVDGLQEEHDANRGAPVFHRMVAAIEYLVKRYPHLPVQTVTVVHRRNLADVPRIHAFLESLGVKFARFGTVLPIGRAPNDPDNFLRPDELRRLLRFIARKKVEEAEGKTSLCIEFTCDGWCGRAIHPEGLEGRVREGAFNCSAGITMATIYADGRMGSCMSLPDDVSVEGNLLEEDPGVIWARGFGRYRNREALRRGPCSTCEEWHWCRGGSMHHRNAEGDLLTCTWNILKAASPEQDL